MKNQKQKSQNKMTILLATAYLATTITIGAIVMPDNYKLNTVLQHNVPAISQEEYSPDLCGLDAVVCPGERVGVIREVTAYNAGDPAQNDSDPCHGAHGDDICKLLEQGKKICAANFVPFHTILHVQNYGDCEVLDRMNSRYGNRVDIAMKLSEKQRALKFGTQHLEIVKLQNYERN